jgi:hypothetical protein
MEMFREYSFMHYENRNFDRPALYEHYHALTGESLSGEADYLHSYWIDLLMRHFAGIHPVEDGVVIDTPMAEKVDFSISGLRMGGRDVALEKEGKRLMLSLDGGPAFLVVPGDRVPL